MKTEEKGNDLRGAIVFFKQVTPCPSEEGGIEFSGHGFGILLGHCQPNRKPPTGLDIEIILATLGYVSLERIEQSLGIERVKTLVNDTDKAIEEEMKQESEGE
jgi:hypothetical protein